MSEGLFETYAKQADKFIFKNYIKTPALVSSQNAIQELSYQTSSSLNQRYRYNRMATESTRFSHIPPKSPINVKSKLRTQSFSGTHKLNKLRKQMRELSESKL